MGASLDAVRGAGQRAQPQRPTGTCGALSLASRLTYPAGPRKLRSYFRWCLWSDVPDWLDRSNATDAERTAEAEVARLPEKIRILLRPELDLERALLVIEGLNGSALVATGTRALIVRTTGPQAGVKSWDLARVSNVASAV